MSSNVPNPREVLDWLPRHFDPQAAGDANATVHLELTGPEGGQWTVRVVNGQCNVLDGLQGLPNLVVTATADDYAQIMNGTLPPMQALMQGRVKFRGDLSLALRMQGWFRRPPNGRAV